MACLGDGEQAHLGTLLSKHQSLAGWSVAGGPSEGARAGRGPLPQMSSGT